MKRIGRFLEQLILGPQFDPVTGRRNWSRVEEAASYGRLPRSRRGFCADCGAPEDLPCWGGCRSTDPWREQR